MSIKKLIEKIKKSDSFLITSHVNLEGDALGSELAFMRLVKKLGKRAVIVNEDDTPDAYKFLPGVEAIKKFRHNQPGIGFDCLVVLDCSSLKRCGEVHLLNTKGKQVINIDHHVSNEFFGDYNWVDPKASCASEVVYQLYKKMNVPIGKDEALCMYVGIVTDTGSFRYTNTTAKLHSIVSELMKFGLDASFVFNRVYGDIPFDDIKLLTKILTRIKRDAGGRVAWLELLRKDIRHKHLRIDLTDQLLNFVRLIKDVEVALLFKENLKNKGEVRVNLRSHGGLDVNSIASMFGGGGHKTASGATIKGNIKSIKTKVINKIREKLY